MTARGVTALPLALGVLAGVALAAALAQRTALRLLAAEAEAPPGLQAALGADSALAWCLAEPPWDPRGPEPALAAEATLAAPWEGPPAAPGVRCAATVRVRYLGSGRGGRLWKLSAEARVERGGRVWRRAREAYAAPAEGAGLALRAWRIPH